MCIDSAVACTTAKKITGNTESSRLLLWYSKAPWHWYKAFNNCGAKCMSAISFHIVRAKEGTATIKINSMITSLCMVNTRLKIGHRPSLSLGRWAGVVFAVVAVFDGVLRCVSVWDDSPGDSTITGMESPLDDDME